MPVRSDMRGEMKRAGSTGSLTRDQPLRLPSGSDSVFDRYDPRYGSSPDISHAHTRSSSNDSTDGVFNHSRQSSGSTDNYPTRRPSTNARKPSAANDPLQFVKANKADDLARSAIQQMEAYKEVNRMRPAVAQPNTKVEEEQDWQSNFDSWKSKRRKSTPSYHKIGEAEGLFKEEEEPQERKTKTFSQIMADKTKRQSLGNLNSYPYDDDDSGFGGKSEPPVTKTTSNMSESQPKKKVSKKEDIAPWARHSSDEGESPSDSETNNSHQSGDTDSVFSDKSIPKVLSDDDSWVKNKTSSQTPSKNKVTPPKIDKPLSESRKLWENNSQKTPTLDEKKKIDLPSRSGDKNIRNIKDAFEQKEKEAHAVPEIRRRPNRLGSDRPWKSMDLTSGYSSLSEKPPSPLSPKSPQALVPKDSRYTSPSHQRYGSLPRDTILRSQESAKDKPFTEKTIKINQKPNNNKGFGFTLIGGIEKRQPVTVQRVNLGSAADVCEVEANDELISINGRDVSSLTLAQVQGIVDHSVKRGQIELKIKRYMEEGSYDSVEEEETANQNKMDTQSSDASSLSTDFTSEETYKPPPRVSPSQNDYHPRPMSPSHDNSFHLRPVDQLIGEPEREANNNIHKYNSQLNEDKPPSPVIVEQISPDISFSSQSVPQTEVHIDVMKDETDGSRPELRRDMSYPAEEMIIEERKTISFPSKNPEKDQSPNVIRRTMIPSKQFAEIKNVESPVPPTPPKVEPPPLVRSSENLNTSITSDDSSSSSVGPPAALLRWQRPKSNTGYKNPFQKSEEQIQAAKRLSSTLPWRPDNMLSLDDYSKDDSMIDKVTKSFEETVSVSKPVESKFESYKFDDEGRQQAWNHKQEQERKPDETPNSTIHVHNFPREETLTAQSAAPTRKLGQVDSPDLMNLNITVPQEEIPLSPQEKFERDQQRIRMQYEEEKRKSQKLHEEQEKRKKDADKFLREMDSNIQTTKQELSSNHSTSLTLGGPEKVEPKFTSEPMTFQLPSQSPARPLVIDPKNYSDYSDMKDDSKPEYVFQVGLPKSEPQQPLRHLNDQPVISSQDLLEQERQKIREEEKRKIEEEQKRWKLEQEREFREQQEKLRAEREKLQQEQEKIAREKAMLEQEKLQPSRNYQSYSSPNSSIGSPVSSISPSPRSPPPALDPKHRENKAPPPTAPKPNRGEKARLTRDDLLAMNRSAKPLTKRPEGTEQSQSHDTSHGSGMREPPSKGELHSLNAVPKQKVRNSGEWINNEERPFVIGKRSDLIHKQNNANSQDHWLVQEAERRRKQEQLERRNNYDSITARAGPTKPSESSLISRFRGDIEPQPRSNRYSGSSLHSTADLGLSPRPLSGSSLRQYERGPDPGVTQFSAKSNNYSNPNLSSTLPANFSFNANTSLPSKPPRSSNSETEPVIAVSGKQKCSHCGEELGFGAAMVIETLGLYYHVQCFRCCVCRTPLGNGAEGADVRVRVNKLHCKNCYSNDEAGLKFSKV